MSMQMTLGIDLMVGTDGGQWEGWRGACDVITKV